MACIVTLHLYSPRLEPNTRLPLNFITLVKPLCLYQTQLDVILFYVNQAKALCYLDPWISISYLKHMYYKT